MSEALVGGFYARPHGTPLGELRTSGVARRHVPFDDPWSALRACVLADGAVTATWELPGGLWHIAFNVGAEAVPLPPLRGRVAHAENVAADAQTLPTDSFIAWYEEHA